MELQPPYPPNHVPVLICYNARGPAQIIRSIMLEAGVPFKEVLVSIKDGIPPALSNFYNLDLNNLPSLIHDNKVIEAKMGIIRYICCNFGRHDLLGIGSQKEIKIMEVLSKIHQGQKKILSCIVSNSKSWIEQGMPQTVQGKQLIRGEILELLDQMKVLIALKKLYLKSNGYLLGQLTVIDFIFYESCFNLEGLLKSEMVGDKIAYLMYKQFFESTPFYQKNKGFLEKYKFIIPDAPTTVNQLINKMWQGDPKYLHFDVHE